MKKIVFTCIAMIFSFFTYSQTIENIEYFAPEQDGLVAIKKGGQWGFMNTSGVLMIPFRKDLVESKNGDISYPIFNNDRCLIKKEMEGIALYGFIDAAGKIVVEPQFLNATNFYKGRAIIVKKVKQKIGENNVLGKRVVATQLEEYVIDDAGKIIKFLNVRNSPPSKVKMVPEIQSKFINANLVATLNKDKKWDLIRIE